MKHQRHFDRREAAQFEAVWIWKMIVNLDRTVQLLDCDIAPKRNRPGYLTVPTPPTRSSRGC